MKSQTEDIKLLEDLQKHEGWMLVVKNIEDNIELLGDCIIDKVDDVTGDSLNEAGVDQLRMKRSLLSELKDTPANMIAEMSKKSEEEPDSSETENDPFYQSIDQIDEDLKKIKKAH